MTVLDACCGSVLSEILALTPEKPLFGHRSGKQQKTHWVAFIKEAGGEP